MGYVFYAMRCILPFIACDTAHSTFYKMLLNVNPLAAGSTRVAMEVMVERWFNQSTFTRLHKRFSHHGTRQLCVPMILMYICVCASYDGCECHKIAIGTFIADMKFVYVGSQCTGLTVT